MATFKKCIAVLTQNVTANFGMCNKIQSTKSGMTDISSKNSKKMVVLKVVIITPAVIQYTSIIF